MYARIISSYQSPILVSYMISTQPDQVLQNFKALSTKNRKAYYVSNDTLAWLKKIINYSLLHRAMDFVQIVII